MKPQQLVDAHLFRELVDQSLDAITVVDDQGVIVFANPVVARLIGEPAVNRVGRAVMELVHADDRAAARAWLARLYAGDADRETMEVRVVRHDGAVLHVEAVGRRWLLGGRVHVLLSSRDVTDRVTAVAELARANELLTKTLRSSRNIVSITRADTGEYLEVNDEWLRVWGHRREEVIGRTSLELGIWGDPANRERLLAAARVAGGRLRDYEITAYSKEGPRQVVVNVETLIEDGEPLILMTGTDVTDSRTTEAQLRQAQKMEAVGQLTGGVAHDFNNLLGVVMGNAELLEQALGQRPELARLVIAILQASQRGATLTRQLLAFSRRQILGPRSVGLEGVVQRMVPLLESTLGPNVAVSLEACSEAWPARVDPAQLENAVLNLALNARDAMPEGGALRFRVRNRPRAEMAPSAEPELLPGDYVSLSVTDSGCGMDREILERAFDPFFTTKDPGQGTGLGLSMVFGFVRQSGGRVDIDSRPGAGARVTLWLPRAAVPEDVDERPAEPIPLARGETVLVLDDEPDLLDIARAYLEQLGYRVLTVRDETSFESVLQRGTPFDVVLSDVLLSGPRQGPEVVAEMRARGRAVPVLYMSGYPTGRLDGRSLTGSSVPMLRKPFTLAELARRIRDCLDG